MLLDNTLELIGNTPIVKLNRIAEGLPASVYAKIEKNNLSGSVKDRAALQMIQDLFDQGKLHRGDTIIEPTSGNTGIALACLANYFDLRCIIVMPESMSLARRKLIKDYRAELVLVSGGMKQCAEKAEQLHQQIAGSIIVGQFDNPSNVKAHYERTAREILFDLPDVRVIVAGIGTGGTISGIGKYIKDHRLNIEMIGVEPFSSPLITLKKAAPHKIQGIGANFIPSILNQEVIHKIALVKDEDALNTAKELVRKESLFVGISSGAVMKVAMDLAVENQYADKKILAIFADSGERYEWN